MRRAITVSALAVGLCLTAAAPGLGGPKSPSTGIHVAMGDGSVRLVQYGLKPGPLTLLLGEDHSSFRGEVKQDGRTIYRDVPFWLQGCERAAGGRDLPPGGRGADVLLEGFAGGRATLREAGPSGEIHVRHPSVPGCILVGKLPPVESIVPSPRTGDIASYSVDPRSGGLARQPKGLAAKPADPPAGGRPVPGGPIQGSQAVAALPDLQIGEAEAVPTDPTKLKVVVRNAGPGPAAATALKLYYTTLSGKVITGEAPVPALAAGQQVGVEIGAGQPLAEAKAVKLRVDDPNKIGEIDELNNGSIFK